MAGAGFKTFTVGEVLTAGDVNTYLMEQAVMTFADSGARGSAIGTAAEGMVSYLADTDAVEVYDGSAWVGVGSDPNPGIGTNAVTVVKTDTFSSSSSSFVDVTGLTVTITPTSDTSRILVLPSIALSGPNENHTYISRLVRVVGGTATTVHAGDASSNRTPGFSSSMYVGNEDYPLTVKQAAAGFIDSPATTSAVTYKFQVRSSSGSGRVNRSRSDTDQASTIRAASSITAIEVKP